ncbi:hypothetical protein EVAR_25059_1 [Eumeta japonica]|uniref:Uncharacterized protein n=1 Tax=Eumeta variegata TaxID=151549 RepID=A0A4C1V9U1_EUMVA|nr:hypothetical protein EVAR_25059_1 [Eumeta japonica]
MAERSPFIPCALMWRDIDVELSGRGRSIHYLSLYATLNTISRVAVYACVSRNNSKRHDRPRRARDANWRGSSRVDSLVYSPRH